MSQPPKSTIRAPAARWMAFNGVVFSNAVSGRAEWTAAAASLPCAHPDGRRFAEAPGNAEREQHSENRREYRRLRDVLLHQPPVMDDAADRDHVDEAMQTLPVAGSQLAHRRVGRRERQRDQHDERS